MGIESCGVAITAPGQGAALIEEGRLVDPQTGVQVLEVVGVADVGVVDLGEQALVEPGLVLPAVHPALVGVLGLQFAFVFLVVQPGTTELTFAAAGQVAELTLHQQTALGHVVGIERGVVVGRQVEVVGRLQAEAGIAGAAEAGREEARLAAVVDREVDVRGIEHRNVLDPQRHVGCRAEAGGRVQLDVVAAHMPGVVARFATGVGAILEADDGIFLALDVLRGTAHVSLMQHVFGVVDLCFTTVQLQLGAVADHQGTLVAQLDVTGEHAEVFAAMQAGFFGLDLHAALAQDHVARQYRLVLLLLVARGFGGEEDRRILLGCVVVHAGTQRFDIGTGAIGAGFGQLGRTQLVARHPVEMAEVSAAGRNLLDSNALAGGGGLASLRRGSRADARGRVLWAWRQWLGANLGRTGPAASGRSLAVELLGGQHGRSRHGLQGKQATSDQQRKLLVKRGEFCCHLVFTGLPARYRPAGPHASRWAKKDAG